MQDSSPKVLIAEEDDRLRRIVRLNLEQGGFSTTEAASLQECELAIQRDHVALVIVSSQLPDFDGPHFTQWLRSHFPLDPVPVVLVSFEPEDRLYTVPLKQAAFERKPFDPEELVDQVTRLLHTA
ncbi:MAG TPA: response regulator [Chloroflexota bacterium]|nr:response regulator [Chloroflexota bacterium]